MHGSGRNNFDNPERSFLIGNDVTLTNILGDNTLSDADVLKPVRGESVPVPPLAEPEDDDKDDRETVSKPYQGIDDGFFGGNGENGVFDRAGGFPYAPGFGPHGEFGGLPTDLESLPDVNLYQHKKTVAQGMMDLALFSANANQLRYVLESNGHPYYYSGVVLIAISLTLQVAVGVGLILNTRYDVKDKKEMCIANKVNNFTVIGIFLVTIINVFISAFGVASNASSTTGTV